MSRLSRFIHFFTESDDGGKVGPSVTVGPSAVASFTSKKAVPIQSLIVNIEPVQTGSGDPSPDNVRPITGFSSVGVTRTGVNIWDEVWEVGSIGNSTGQNTDDANNIRSKNYIIVTPNTTYYFYEGYGANVRLYWYDNGYNFLSTDVARNIAVTAPSNARYLRIRTTSTYGDTYNNDISVNYPSTETDYHKSSAISVSVSLGSTVYGGTLDIVSGVLKARPYYASYSGQGLVGPWISSMDKYVAGTTPTTGAQVVDMGGAETTTQLTPNEVSTLLNENHVWSDAGLVTVTAAGIDPLG